MTFVLALVEFGLLLVLASCSRASNISVLEAIDLLLGRAGSLAVDHKVVVLPIISLTYLESAGEFRRVEWSMPPEQVSLPVLASAAEAAPRPGQLLAEASGVRARPLQPLPPPSGVRAVPKL